MAEYSEQVVDHFMHPRNVGCLTAAGIDCCALANNHVLDWGYSGLAETLDTLKNAGIEQAGAGRNAPEAAQPAVMDKDLIGKNADVILSRIGVKVDPSVRLAVMDVPADHPLVWTEQLMPVLPLVRCANIDQAIEWALAAEQNMGHTMAIHSNSITNIQKMAGKARCASFVKNGACGLGGVGVTGEGFVSFHIATNGEGHTRPRMFTQIRRCVMTDDLRYRYGTEVNS